MLAHTFRSDDDGFDNDSSAFLREEVGEIFFVVHEEVFDEGGRAEGVFFSLYYI